MDKIDLSDITNALNEIDGLQPEVVKEWFIAIDRLLVERGCKVKFQHHPKGGTIFDYHSKKAKTRICRIDIGKTSTGIGCRISIQGNHFATPYSITNELPEEMIFALKNSRRCKPCKDPRMCGASGYFDFLYNDENIICCSFGVAFIINEETEFEWLKKWIENELRWSENDYLSYPLRKTLINETDSSYTKRWKKRKTVSENTDGAISIFEQTNKEQRLVKPSIDDAVDYFLTDESSRKSMTRLINFVRGLDMEPCWKSKNRYDCRYNLMDALYIRFEGKNDFNVTVKAFYWERKAVFEEFLHSLPDEKKERFIDIKEFHCTFCHESCNISMEFKMPGKDRILCSSGTYVCENPAPEQLEVVEWLIGIGRDYIDFKKQKR